MVLPQVKLPLTALYSGAVGILFVLLSLRVTVYRAVTARKRYVETAVVQPQLGVANKSGVVRAHVNLAEYYAAFFLLLAILECNEAADSKVLNCLGTG
ncbi:TPA: hypothetical protein ACH3X2_003198 [Trebouxia sp. C0005]